jgi:pyruvate,orthophosphate dikinase
MGKCCVAGAGDVRVNEEENYFEVKGVRYPEGSVISIDGSTGYIYDGAVPTVPASVSGDLATLMTWADKKPCFTYQN